MSLWGTTDNLAGKPKFIARTAGFTSSNINATDNSFDISLSGTGFNTGDAVVYTGNAVGPTSGSTYYARVIAAGVVTLYGTAAQAIAGGGTGLVDVTNVGTGDHTLQGTGNTGILASGGDQIIFVDAQEAQVTANKAKGLTNAGWWVYKTYTDAQSTTRHKAECLIALSINATDSGDAEDTVAADLAITIGTHPQNASVTAPATATFTVAATINSATELTYQWQIQQEGSGAWTDITGATAASYTTGATATGDGAGATDGDKYRVVITAGGLSATSNAATLTVA